MVGDSCGQHCGGDAVTRCIRCSRRVSVLKVEEIPLIVVWLYTGSS